MNVLGFEQPFIEIQDKIKELMEMASGSDSGMLKDIEALKQKSNKILKNAYANLTAWDKVQIARHENRPKSSHYINTIFTDIVSLEGDKLSGNDHAILSGLALFEGKPVIFMGQEKGTDLETRTKHNFGMCSPSGYRKVSRLIKLANQWKLPVIFFVDTSGAYPGKKAEEQGQAHAIAQSMADCFELETPSISVVIGEGGSGGAMAIGVTNKVLMLEYSVYSIASPEACSSILWKDASMKERAAQALKLTAEDLRNFGYVDEIIPEHYGAHNFHEETINNVKNAISLNLKQLSKLDPYILRQTRKEKFLNFKVK